MYNILHKEREAISLTIGEVIKQYREEHGMSQRQFAIKCNMSNGYVSMLENGVNPKTKQPIMPSISALNTIASAMNISLHELLLQADDMPVNLSQGLNLQSVSETDKRLFEFIDLFSKLLPEQQEYIVMSMKGIAEENKRKNRI